MKDFEDEEEFSEEEFNKINKLAQKETREQIRKIIEENTDERTKYIGDKVLVWDGSRLTDEKTGEYETNPQTHYILAHFPSVVIENQVKHVARLVTFTGDYSVTLDLRVWNKKLNKVYRTSSRFVKLFDGVLV